MKTDKNTDFRPIQSTGLVPAVPIAGSVTQDYLFCLEDGRPMKMLKQYLFTHFGLTPSEYRAKWGLPSDYPMVAPGYALQKRRALSAVKSAPPLRPMT